MARANEIVGVRLVTKRPSLQFYPADWRKDLNLQSCSLEARGLWAEMLWLMHEGTPYGYLRAGSKVISKVNLASLVGSELKVIECRLQELEEAVVFSRAEDGAIYSRRMVRDEIIRNKRACGGKKGGNPALIKGVKDNRKVNYEDKQMVEEEVVVEDEDEDSCSKSNNDGPIKPSKKRDRVGIERYAKSTGFEAWWKFYPGGGDKQDGMKAWVFDLTDDMRPRMLDATKEFLDRRFLAEKSRGFVPHLKLGPTFIRQRGWEFEFQNSKVVNNGEFNEAQDKAIIEAEWGDSVAMLIQDLREISNELIQPALDVEIEVLVNALESPELFNPDDLFEMEGRLLASIWAVLDSTEKEEIDKDSKGKAKKSGAKDEAFNRTARAYRDDNIRKRYNIPHFA